ncbi:MAG: GtrA family protein [Clostridiaceae bacterium]|nr:GtrA family protein [Clostridiaceae bacterium]
MIKTLWNKFVNRESVSYIIFGVLTTLVDWVVYTVLWSYHVDYRVSTIVSWAAAVLFAFVTNKFWVFRSYEMRPAYLWKEFAAFVSCRAATGLFTLVGMMIMVQGMHLHELIGKVFVSAASLVLNYVFSKLFIFKNKS